MKRSAPPSCRHRAGRRGVDGCAVAPGSRPWRPRRLALLFAVAVLGGPSCNLARAACSNGLEGVESSSGDVCCVEACGTCGGEGCSNIVGLDDGECCTSDIKAAGVVCGNGNTAPCIIDGSAIATSSPAIKTPSPQTAPSQAPTTAPQTPTGPTASQPPTASPQPPVSPTPTGAPLGATAPTVSTGSTSEPVVASVTTAPITMPPVTVTAPAGTRTPAQFMSSNCTNGFPGWQNNDACCSEFCGQCGGEGCGALGSADCCYDNIINKGLVCGRDTSQAPCIIEDTLSPTPTPLAAGETLSPNAPTQAPVASAASAPPVTVATLSPALPTAAPAARMPTPMPGTSAGATPTPLAAGETRAPQATTSPEQDANTPPAETEDETCSNDLPGFQHGVVCCPLSCGQCGGSGCENIAGTEGASDCCSDVILTGGVMCDSTAVVPVVAPCVIGTVDDVESAREAANAATGLRKTGGVGGTASAVGIACAVGAAAATASRFAH